MRRKYTIGEIASFYGISKDTLRLYEKKGILKSKKGENNYRMYDREDVLVLNYVLKLKKMDYSLDEIKTLLNDSSILHMEAAFTMQAKIISDKIEELKALDETIVEYKRYAYDIIHNLNKLEIVALPCIIYTEFDDCIGSEIKINNNFSENLILRCAFITDAESFMRDDIVVRMINRDTRVDVFSCGMAVIDKGGIHKTKEYDKNIFKIIGGGKAVHGIIKCIRDENYEMVCKVQDYIRENNLQIKENVYMLSSGIQRNNQSPEDYYEIWIPVK